MKYIASVVFSLCLILLFLYASVFFIGFNEDFYEREYEKNGVYDIVGIEKTELSAVTKHMLDYLKGKTPDLHISAFYRGETRQFFNEKEIFHMNDVLKLFNTGKLLKNISLVFVLCFSVFVFASGKKMLTIALKTVCVTFVSLLAISAILAAIICIDFDSAFTAFHKLFFSNDMWLLDPATDMLINIVPLEFFIDIAVRIGILFFSLSAATAAASGIFARAALRCKREN